MRLRPNIQAGFTLMELLVVILIVGILTGVMFVEMRGTFEDALLRSSARDLMSGLNLASSRAVSLNQAHSFVLDAAKNEFTVQAKPGGDPASAAAAEKPWMEVHKIDERITIELRDPSELPSENEEYVPSSEREVKSDLDGIVFYPDGTADRREIVLRDRNDVELALGINPVTGRVRILEEAN